jgi:DNA-binding Xre family transcriptional regulator
MIRLKLKEILEEKKLLNKSEVARQVDLSRWSFSKLTLHNSDRIELNTIEKLCKGLNITPNELFEITNDDGSLWKPRRK